MNREELLDLIPLGEGSPNSTKYYFKLGPLAGLRLSVVMADDDTDFDALWKEIEPELDALVKEDKEWAKEEAFLLGTTSDEVEKLVWNLAAGYECGAGPYCHDCDWNGITGGCRMRDAIAAAGIQL